MRIVRVLPIHVPPAERSARRRSRWPPAAHWCSAVARAPLGSPGPTQRCLGCSAAWDCCTTGLRPTMQPDRIRSAILKQPPNRAENANTVGIEDRWYMRRTPPPSRPPPSSRPPRPSRPPMRPSPRPLPRRRTGAGVRLLIIALVGIILILATMLTIVEAQRCREGFQAPVCRI